jgi:histone H2A
MATPSKKSGAKVAKKSGSKSKSSKAGLTFPVPRVGKLLRRGRYMRRVSPAAAVYLTATLEFLAHELLGAAVKALPAKKHRVTPRAITLGVRKDSELGVLLKNVTLSRGGVVPNVQKAVDKKKKSSKKASTTPRV